MGDTTQEHDKAAAVEGQAIADDTASALDPSEGTDPADAGGGEQTVTLLGRKMPKSDVIKFAGLIAFFAVIAAACVALWPLISNVFEPGGVETLISNAQNAGIFGVLILLAVEFLQVVVAFIPGEVVQVAAGLMYGPWLGALVIFAGCIISSAFVFVLVHKLGAPFVQAMVPTKYLAKFRHFEEKGRLNIVVFILFFIPGLPKDVFTYLVPLTDMRMSTFLVLANVARIPGIVVSTYAASGLAEGDYVQSIVIFAVVAVIAIIGILCRERIIGALEKRSKRS